MGAGMTPTARPAVSFFRSHVAHVRLRPYAHRFSYVVPAISVDIDRLDEANHVTPMFSIGKFNLLSFHPADHGARDNKPLRGHVEALARSGGISRDLSRIELVCMPRVLGSAFNPLSVFYCWTSTGLGVLIYEVRNTFGQSHSYVMPVRESQGTVTPHACDKHFFVSPFMDMALRYRFLVTIPGETLNLKIIVRDEREVVLTALLSARRVEPKSATLMALALPQFLGGLKVLGAIHFEALRLWLKGHHIRPRPDAPPAAASFGEAGGDTRSNRP
jgi:uncharacterized protein